MRINCVPLRPARNIEDVIGYALDMVTAIINHSCVPNAFVTFEGCQLRVRSLRPIAAGEEITVSYADPSMPVFNRQKFLRDMYFFECHCRFRALCIVSSICVPDAERSFLQAKVARTMTAYNLRWPELAPISQSSKKFSNK